MASLNPVLDRVKAWRDGGRWSAAVYGGRALRAELVMAQTPPIDWDQALKAWVPETKTQVIERILASLPDLCGNYNGTGTVELDGYGDGVMAIDHADCPVCHGETGPEDDE